MNTSTKAGILLGVHALFWLLGTPGIDFIGEGQWDTKEERASFVKRVGQPWAQIAFVLADLNRHLRLPVVDLVAPIQRPFRISQEWSLYRDGPSRYRRMEILVDGDLKHRSVDDAYPWLAAQIRSRRIRPMMEAVCMSKTSPNWRGFVRYVAERAQVDFPGAQEVEVRCMEGPFPGTTLTLHHSYLTQAPDWAPVLR